MVISISALLQELQARLPELEWKMAKLGTSLSSKAFPKGLFRLSGDASPAAFVLEIKTDIQILANHQNNYSGYYIAERIHQKINLLVSLCRLQRDEFKKYEEYNYLKMISTKQQFLQTLQKEITHLSEQHQALNNRLNQSQSSLILLNLKTELGQLEKRLGAAKEAYDKATRW
jgi:hypothetical protein